jgi:predicted RNA-binding Zn ribbon-like protein
VTPFQPGGRAPAPPPLDLVQDFVNTEIPEWAQDDLGTPEELGAWLVRRGLTPACDVVGAGTFVQARELRAALRELALANTHGHPPRGGAHDAIQAALGRHLLTVGLAEDGAVHAGPAGTGAERGLAAIVVAVLEAERSGTWGRLKACRKEGCGWVFFDQSRNRSSNWCSMTICGNRTKTAVYRRRRAGGSK